MPSKDAVTVTQEKGNKSQQISGNESKRCLLRSCQDRKLLVRVWVCEQCDCCAAEWHVPAQCEINATSKTSHDSVLHWNSSGCKRESVNSEVRMRAQKIATLRTNHFGTLHHTQHGGWNGDLDRPLMRQQNLEKDVPQLNTGDTWWTADAPTLPRPTHQDAKRPQRTSNFPETLDNAKTQAGTEKKWLNTTNDVWDVST